MCISTTNVSLISYAQAKKFGNPKYYECKDPPPPTPNPPKRRKWTNSIWNDFKCQISTSIVLSNQKMITGKITFRRNQNMLRNEHSYIFLTTKSCSGGDVTLAATPNELHNGIWR
jgi:hypothetical protein